MRSRAMLLTRQAFQLFDDDGTGKINIKASAGLLGSVGSTRALRHPRVRLTEHAKGSERARREPQRGRVAGAGATLPASRPPK